MNIYERFLYDEWDLETIFRSSNSSFWMLEQQYELDVSDACFRRAAAHALHHYRPSGKRRLHVRESTLEEKPFENLLVYELAGNILEVLGRRYHLAVSEAEIQYLASKLYYCCFTAGRP